MTNWGRFVGLGGLALAASALGCKKDREPNTCATSTPVVTVTRPAPAASELDSLRQQVVDREAEVARLKRDLEVCGGTKDAAPKATAKSCNCQPGDPLCSCL